MSDSIKLFCQGYIAAPVLDAFRRHGLFERLDTDMFRERAWLVKELGGNEGYFTVALQMLVSLGLLDNDASDGYRLRVGVGGDWLDLDLGFLYSVQPDALLTEKNNILKFGEIAGRVLLCEQASMDFSGKLARNAVIAQFLLCFKEQGTEKFFDSLSRLDAQLAEAVKDLSLHWAEASGDVVDMLSYCRPLLNSMEDLLFGDSTNVSALLERAAGTFFSREINLLRENHFEDLKRIVIDFFDPGPLDCRSSVVIDANCGGASLLKQVYSIIHSETARGRHLEECPVNFVAIGSDRRTLDEVALEHEAHLGCHPDELMRILGRYDLEQGEGLILHVGPISDCHIDAKSARDADIAGLVPDQPAHYLDCQGNLLAASDILICWYRRLQALSRVLGGSSLLVLQPHISPSINRDRDVSGAHIDFIRGLSHQCLISAEAFITLAASVGLFNRYAVKRYPAVSDFCDVALHCLSKRDYIIRHAVENDLARLNELEKLCWKHTRTSRQRIMARLKKYPRGQFVLEKDGQVLGVVYSQRIADVEVLKKYNAANVHELHEESGSIVQLLAINVDPQVQNLGYGDQLLEFMLQRCSLITGVRRVVGVTLCKNFGLSGERSFERYIRRQGGGQDPVLAFHEAHGASIVAPVASYRPQDGDNRGYGVLVEYDLLNREPRTKIVKAVDNNATVGTRFAFDRERISRFVQETVAQLLGGMKNRFDLEQPLMEMGLDSADLLKLQKLIEDEYHQKLQPGFFFEFNNLNKVTGYLADQLDVHGQTGLKRAAGGGSATRSEVGTRPTAAGNSKPREVTVPTDIAIVGVSCKLPGGIETPEQLWRALASGDCVIAQYPNARGSWPSSADKPGIDRGGFIERADSFDAAFFRISPTEAMATDPQQRILLELAWHCMEDAGILPEAFKGVNAGVFIGASNCDYSRLLQAAGVETQAHHATGSSLAVLANRLSYFFDWSGPSLLIDTACSASLVALHAAVQSLKTGECSAALAGGVNLICHPDLSIAYHKAGMLSPDGRCKVFDARADGYVRSEGAVMFLLKPLSRAVEEGDRIHAVIKGSAVNHGGLAGGLTVPNPQKQSELLVAAWKNAGISPEDLSYIEAHGTGTSLGDPIEVQGIQTAYASLVSSPKAAACALGSVKSNLGHLEAAAGMTGLLKVVLAMRHRQIPASINFERLNPKINLDGTPFYIADSLREWRANGPRLAGVSSFGSGGANAHVVVEEWVPTGKPTARDGIHLMVVSARNRERLSAYAASIVSWIERFSEDVSFADFIYTFQTGRAAMEERLAILASDFMELKTLLNQWTETEETGDSIWQENVDRAFEKISLLLQGDAGSRILDAALAEKNLKQLAFLWTSGFNIDFRALYKEAPGRISAPSYPFADRKYWVEVPVKERTHSLLGSRVPSVTGTVFSKTWDGFPGSGLFVQGDFSCMSPGFVLETFVSAGKEIFPLMEVVAVENFRYYPFHLEKGNGIVYETRCYPRGRKVLAELVHVLNEEKILIAETELEYSERNDNKFDVDISRDVTEWISSEERGFNHLPVETLGSIFPALLNEASFPVVSIPAIRFYRSPVSPQPMLIAMAPEGISILTSEKQPVLSIIGNRQVNPS